MKDDEKVIVEQWRDVLKEFLDPFLMMRSFQTSVFEVGKEYYLRVFNKLDQPHAAVDDIIDIILESDAAFEDFISAMKQSDCEWLAKLISGEVNDGDVEKAADVTDNQFIVRGILTDLSKRLEEIVGADEIARLLQIKGILNLDELQQIEAETTRLGNIKAVRKLVMFLVRKPPGWWIYFTEIVKELGYEHRLVDSLEAHFKSEPRSHPISDVGEDNENISEGADPNVNAKPTHVNKGARSAPRLAPNFSLAFSKESSGNLSLRKYQEYLAGDASTGKNVIICAPTGSGKTRVAAHVIYTRFNDTLTDKNHKIAFLVPRVALAKQQSDSIKKYFKSHKWTVDYMIGDSKSTLKDALLTTQVIVLTPQILVNALNTRDVTLTEFSLLVFDECHHAIKGDPYTQIMFCYHDLKGKCQNLPQVIGLTATLGIGGGKTDDSAVEHILALCANLDATGGIITVPVEHHDELNKHTPQPAEKSVVLESDNDPFTVFMCNSIDGIIEILYNLDIKKIKGVTRPHALRKADQQYIQWCQDFREKAATYLNNNQRLCMDVQMCVFYVKVFNEALDLHLKCRPTDAIDYLLQKLDDQASGEKSSDTEVKLQMVFRNSMAELLTLSTDERCQNTNLKMIQDEIMETFQKDRSSRAMLNVQKRQYAVPIRDWLNESHKLKDLELKAEYFTGVGKSKAGITKGLTHNRQEQILEMFRSGEVKILVCTPEVANEGLDIVDCNLVITYDYVKNEISKSQTKGRARKEGGKMVQFSSRKVQARDKANTARILKMDLTTRKVQAMQKDSYLRALKRLQDDTILGNSRRKSLNNRNDKKMSSSAFQVKCKKCSAFICRGNEIVKVGTNHTCVAKDFKERFNDRVVNDGGTETKKGLFCKTCDQQWGIFSRFKKLIISQLYPDALLFIDEAKNSVTNSQWNKIHNEILLEEVEYNDFLLKFGDISI